MKKYVLFLTTVLLVSTSFSVNAAFVSNPSGNLASSNHLKPDHDINLSHRYLESFRGKRMNIIDRIFFKMLKKNIKKELKKNPNMSVSEYYLRKTKKRLAWGWWLLIILGSLLLIFLIVAAIAQDSFTDNPIWGG